MKIGELAQHVGCTVETIRFYEKEGLLQKPLRNTENNYREYQSLHLERLRFIRRCRSLSMTHDEIRTLLTARTQQDDCIGINQLVDQHLEHVQHRIQELLSLEQELQELRLQCQGDNSVHSCGILRELERDTPVSESLENVHSTQIHSNKH
ncbi:Cd(II)/Pb(II)-responsive transcriptional regulator [Acinetobacter rudis]|uniref:Cd(II)/Pb(II)-responsive transcriptional regulator n=1 Tax=Acinetobacter rudis TaxID=632955 RepID=A0AAW8J4W1_9GAMM|nr:Cd(II)/Pb(II)-responsive transcriptional regulator [Acinetobacter rudis]MDQ8934214.1 Cd(II)/Pb(II)-responsive transcriptional regulator [Acinetobacter rudis]MDQ8952629.1 Cd(II)/Pb(II)-responsive transcriptional regulator [Acinetobacter rudis]MDQ9016478.1 Cd(II)/Pb(II)-responsive transcriptional regulator [Acinetobacter rudis]